MRHAALPSGLLFRRMQSIQPQWPNAGLAAVLCDTTHPYQAARPAPFSASIVEKAAAHLSHCRRMLSLSWIFRRR